MAARAKIEPKMGPIHGVHPKPKAAPITMGLYIFLLFSKNFKKNINLVSKIGGLILLITGILILTNQLQALGYYILNIFPFLQNFG